MLDRNSVMLCVFLLAAVMLVAPAAQAMPIIPTIDGPEINFSAALRYVTGGSLPDLLISKDAAGSELMTKYEAGTYWPNYPLVVPAIPLWYEESGTRYYAADVQLAVKFTGTDAIAAPGFPSVSLIGTGAGADAQMIADVEIWGTTATPGTPAVNELLWAVQLDAVSLYGYAGDDTFVLEGMGTMVGGSLAVANDLLGQAGVIRGHIDLSGLIGADYDPIADNIFEEGTATYSGETGVPEPASLALLAIGGLGVLRRRR